MNVNQRESINRILKKDPELKGFSTFLLSGDSPGTVVAYLEHIRKFRNYVCKPMNRLDLDDFTGYLEDASYKQDGTQVVPSYKICIYHALKNYAAYLCAKGVLKTNPMAAIKRPASKETIKTKEKREKGYLKQDEIKDYLENLTEMRFPYRYHSEFNNKRDMAIIYIFLSTGIRQAALRSLNVNSIRFEEKKLIVVDKESKINEHLLNDKAMDAINSWLKERTTLFEYEGVDPLFVTDKNNRISESTVQRITKRYYDNKDKSISPHKLRATYGTQLYEQTKDLYFVQKCMSHSNPQVTTLYIRGQQDKVKDQAADIMGSLL